MASGELGARRARPRGAAPLRLLIAGGGSGGHVYAGLAVARAFRARQPDAEVLLVGRMGGMEETAVPAAGFRLETIEIRGLNRDRLWLNLRLFDILPRALRRGLRVLGEFRPDVVLGVGAYPMIPCGWAALRRGVPYVLQVSEPNALAQNMLREGAAAACLTFAEDVALFPCRRAVVTGYPLRAGFRRRHPNVPPRHLLVMGGSLGAKRLNEAVWAGLDRLLDMFEEITHLTGAQGAREGATHTRDGYRPIFLGADVPSLLNVADLVVSRAGLGTCAEITAVGLPAVLVPGSFGGGHQEQNAARLTRASAATRLADGDLSADTLVAHLRELGPDRLRGMAAASAALGRFDAAGHIVEVLMEEAERGASRRVGLTQAAGMLISGVANRVPTDKALAK